MDLPLQFRQKNRAIKADEKLIKKFQRKKSYRNLENKQSKMNYQQHFSQATHFYELKRAINQMREKNQEYKLANGL